MDITDARLVGDLARDIRYGGSSLDMVPRMLRELLERDCWRDFTSLTGKPVHHETWASFVTTVPASGLGSSLEVVDRLVGRDAEVLALLKEAKAGRPGRRSDLAPPGESPGGHAGDDRDEDHAARLRRDRPDLLASIAAGRHTLNSAAVEAGYRHRRVSVRVDSAASAAASLRKAMRPAERQELARLLLEQ